MVRVPSAVMVAVVALIVSGLGVTAGSQTPAGIGSPDAPFDLIIRHGRLIDGTGNPWRRADVGIRGDQIVAIGDLSRATATTVIDATGRVVAPGFIDTHTHCDGGLSRSGSNTNLNYLAQGVTTVVTGNCGSGTFRVANFAARTAKRGLGTNAVHLIGYGDVRGEVMGRETRAPTEKELEALGAIVRRGMSEGAWGMSTGLEYTPGTYTSTEELVTMAKVVAEFDGVYMSHQRNEFDGVVEATLETIRIGRESGIRVLTSHFKACGKDNWGSLRQAVDAITAARAAGVQVFADQYPYEKPSVEPLISIRSNRGWSCFRVPDEEEPFKSLRRKLRNRELTPEDRKALQDRYVAELARGLAEPATRARIRKAVMVGTADRPSSVSRAGWDSYGIVSSRTHPEWVGGILSDLARKAGRDPFDLAAELAVEEPDMILTSGVMSPDDVRHAMRQRWLMISSDGDAYAPVEAGARPRVGHPRSFGSQARVLRKFVREEGVLSLEDAVRKMTSLPASFLGMRRRGIVAEGYHADLVVFDPGKVRDNATFLDCRRYASGIDAVIVGGVVSHRGGAWTGAHAGRLLLRSTQ